MGKIVMPKNSALLNEIEAVLKIYYEAGDWLANDVYKAKLKQMIGDDQYSSSYTKKAQITSYFGFTEWQDIRNPQSLRRITAAGKRMYEALVVNDEVAIQEVLMTALETVKFGRNNFGCPESNSDIEPPALFIRASIDLGYLTYREFAYLLWKLEDIGANYTDSLADIRTFRTREQVELGDEAQKYTDCKPIMILVRWGFLSEDVETSGGKHIVVDPTVKQRFNARLRNLKIYNIDMDCADPYVDDEYSENTPDNESINFDTAPRLTGGVNVLLYGVPGSGKSWTIEHEYCKPGTIVERLVFHPDYTNADFVGQILPVVDPVDKQVTYEFAPGPFTNILRAAYTNPHQKHVLVIEEINRGNAPAIFGDVFQLLDRSVAPKAEDGTTYPPGTSEYGITNANVAKVVYGHETHKVRIPSNLSILGTMNTSDQNVFTLDTAFQRRWKMRLVENDFLHVRTSLAQAEILDTGVTWKTFCETVNKIIIGNKARIASAEDKRLGVYFVHEDDLKFDDRAAAKHPYTDFASEYNDLLKAELMNGTQAEAARLAEVRDALMQIRIFPEKVIKYLWDDAFKFNLDALFDIENMDSLEEVIRTFVYSSGSERFKVFKSSVQQKLYPSQQ